MVTASTGWAQAPPEQGAFAVSLVLRDMGNGVTRVLHAACVGGGVPPADFFEVFGAAEVPIPLGPRLRDALDCAMLTCGCEAGREFAGGFMRPLTEDITEFFVW
jgi:hypothetical protein